MSKKPVAIKQQKLEIKGYWEAYADWLQSINKFSEQEQRDMVRKNIPWWINETDRMTGMRFSGYAITYWLGTRLSLDHFSWLMDKGMMEESDWPKLISRCGTLADTKKCFAMIKSAYHSINLSKISLNTQVLILEALVRIFAGEKNVEKYTSWVDFIGNHWGPSNAIIRSWGEQRTRYAGSDYENAFMQVLRALPSVDKSAIPRIRVKLWVWTVVENELVYRAAKEEYEKFQLECDFDGNITNAVIPKYPTSKIPRL